MKKILLIITAALGFLATAYAQKTQYKVEESSAKKMPEWVMSVERDYLNVSATGGTIEEAQAAVTEKIKQQIAQSIATRIVSETNLHTSYYESGDQVSDSQSLETSIMSRTAKLPFIGEISLAKAVDYYWEKRYYKSTGKYEYFYAVKYPFSEFDMKKLVMEYQEHDRKLDEQLNEYEAGIDFITSVEEIGEAINDLKAFQNEFDTYDPRYGKVQALSNSYRSLYDRISLDWFQEKKGTVVVNLTLAGRGISTSQKPVIKSNCATQISHSFQGNALVIKYNDENCYDEDENWLEVRIRTGNKYLTEKIYIKNKVDISLTGIVSDGATGEPVAYAKLTLIPGGKTATTGRNGMYVFNDIPSGEYSIQTVKFGYRTAEASASVVSGNTSRRDIVITPDGNAIQIPSNASTTANSTETAPAEQPAKPSATSAADPLQTVRNGLAAYFRFNGSTRSEVSAIQGNPVNSPMYVPDGPDGTQAISVSSIDASQISFPKPLIVYPAANYSVTFWMKGFSDGHVWSLANGNIDYNYPKLIISDGKFTLHNKSRYDAGRFNHPSLDYNWHFIAITVKTDEKTNMTTACLYIDGVLTDSINIKGGYAYTATTKFLLGGNSESGDNAIDTSFDNLRVYNSRALSDKEVAQIYMSEK